MVQHKGKWIITIAMAVCLIVVSDFGNQQTMATGPTKKLVINEGLYKIKKDRSSLQKLSSDWADNLMW
ncbi:hypothetical protein [Brevibacillus fortis]|uniref:hypothetical protein n=1 Tax=Brevibacillus fortis TaxID=2126352 RepID=UPI0038FD3515